MRIIDRLFSCLALFLAIAAVPVLPVRAAETCPFISAQQLAGAMPALKWSLISNQDGRGCIYQGGRGDTMMLTVFRNPDKDRARELYATFVKTLGERMPLNAVAEIGDEGQGGTSASGAERQEASVVALSGDYILQISVYPIGRRADDALLRPITEAARVAIASVGKSSERFGNCEWLTAADADGFLDNSTLTVQRTGAGSCMMFDREANTMTVAVIAMSRDTVIGMMKRTGPCKHVTIPELGSEAFGEHSCTKGNGNAVNIYVWKNGRQASILFAPVKPHPESGSVERLRAVAGRVYGKL
ncbi:hypothetical protein [Bradyrhizobium japonicum]|uniref:hypothetical protein n=1 Tax=Bradyrhizobium japonicum TaxID=375 RepID=UPI000456A72A|nr:hypothetical protein [Bradyrhizobium japonicum]AHY50298.1 hypothetical protein BJS_03141 [Bradyrhizobium japonicum SEMIA 5079]MEB2674729.1 hypothetical protein [Bradyrhizobium japonicum]WRI75514.1 hypothetical protein RZE83_20870 [Bradyrhizobium japonicum]WRI84313.1 hypothetical protein R3F76_20775 [Bradyrhizobium japonicum]WRI93888.1 hypothetical protein R3F75_24290 [Bradyrhizobium japonicum]